MSSTSGRLSGSWNTAIRHQSALALGALAVIGIVLRLRQYLEARSLWEDEIALSNSLRDLGLLEIATTTLAHGQSAPPGFLLASRAAVGVLGANEYGLRLVPLLAGFATVILSVFVARRLLRTLIAQVAFVSLIVFSPALIYYSNEVKQYAFDVLALLIVVLLWSYRTSPRAPLLLGVGGLIVATMSLPGIIGLFALGLAVLIEKMAGERTWSTREWATVGVLWAVGIGLQGLYNLRFGAPRDDMRAWWGNRGAFPPDSLTEIGELEWYPLALMRLVWNGIGGEGRVGATGSTGWTIVFVAVVFLIVFGLRHRPDIRALFGFTFGIAWVLAELQFYPSSGRTALYLIPVIFLLIACGLEGIVERQRVGVQVTGLLAVGLLLLVQLSTSAPAFASPVNQRDMKWVASELESRGQPDDAVVFEDWSWSKSWYIDAPGLSLPTSIVGAPEDPDDESTPGADLSEFQRLWVASADTNERPQQLTELLVETGPFTEVCTYHADQTYLALLIRDDLVDQVDRDEVCSPANPR